MKGVVYVDSKSLSGGLTVWWQEELKVVVLDKNKSLIDTNMEDNDSGH